MKKDSPRRRQRRSREPNASPTQTQLEVLGRLANGDDLVLDTARDTISFGAKPPLGVRLRTFRRLLDRRWITKDGPFWNRSDHHYRITNAGRAILRKSSQEIKHVNNTEPTIPQPADKNNPSSEPIGAR